VSQIRYMQAFTEALKEEMLNNPDVFVIGEDVRESIRGMTKGLYKEFGPERVIDTPISEQGFTSMSIGAAIAGMRPVVKFMLSEFIFYAFDQLIDEAAKLRYMSGGKLKIPITFVVVGSGARGCMAGQHSDNPYPFLLHGGMKVVIPSSPHDAKGLLKASIRDDDPVAIFLPIALAALKGEVPDKEYIIPLGVGEIKREGTDITIIATGHLVNDALKLADECEKEGISVEVFDPRTLLPLDREMMIKSVSKTKGAVIFDDSNRTCGFASEVSAILMEECFSLLKAPVRRVTRCDVPVPFSYPLEQYVLPNSTKVKDVIDQLLNN